MKKIGLLVTAFAIGLALSVVQRSAPDADAGALNVPFFLDAAAASGGWPPSSGTFFFVALNNTTGSSITVTITYYDDSDGSDVSGAGSATLVIQPQQTLAFRPANRHDAVESANTGVQNLRRSTDTSGSMTITWPAGNPTDIQGRGVQMDFDNGNAFSYLLPEGV